MDFVLVEGDVEVANSIERISNTTKRGRIRCDAATFVDVVFLQDASSTSDSYRSRECHPGNCVQTSDIQSKLSSTLHAYS